MVLRLSSAPSSTLIGSLAAGLLLAGCHAKIQDKDGSNESASISFGNSGDASGNDQTVSVDVPGFSAKLNVPNLDIGSDTNAIDNLKFYPGTKVAGMKIVGDAGDGSGGESKGNVDMRFTAPGSPTDVVNYYKGTASQSGWTVVPPAGDEQFAATRTNDHGGNTRFALVIGVQGSGSSGVMRVTGH